MGRWSCGEGRRWFVGGETLEQVIEVGLGELPLERGGDLLVVVLEGQQPGFYLGEAAEVVGGQEFALYDGEVNFDLVDPGCVDGQVNQAQGGPLALEPAGCGLAAVTAAVIDHPVHMPGRLVGLGGHDLGDEPPERLDSSRGLAPAEDLRAVHVP